MKRCYLVRHAQTIWNGENRLQGHSDLPLSPLGMQQAEFVGAFFASRKIRTIFTSHLQRSRQTAQAIASGNGHGVLPIIEQDLAEMHLGVWEGLTPQEIDAKFAGAYQQWKTNPSSVHIPQAEPHSAFRRRVRGVAEKITAQLSEGEHVVVSHGGVIAAMLADLLEADYDLVLRRVRLDNAGITAVEFASPQPHVLWINATNHLEAMTPGSGASEWL